LGEDVYTLALTVIVL